MPTAFSIAAVQYTAPAKDGADADASGLRYSCHAKKILPFLVRHRTVLASHVQICLSDGDRPTDAEPLRLSAALNETVVGIKLIRKQNDT